MCWIGKRQHGPQLTGNSRRVSVFRWRKDKYCDFKKKGWWRAFLCIYVCMSMCVHVYIVFRPVKFIFVRGRIFKTMIHIKSQPEFLKLFCLKVIVEVLYLQRSWYFKIVVDAKYFSVYHSRQIKPSREFSKGDSKVEKGKNSAAWYGYIETRGWEKFKQQRWPTMWNASETLVIVSQ